MRTEKQLANSYTPLISVIVASYNYARLITETLDSILAQTYKNYEIVVVDDGSKDDSLEVIKRYVDNYENVFLYTHPNHENRGLPATVRLGIDKAKGEYVAFCESDDYWHPTHLEKKVELINSFDDVEIISNNIEMFGDEQTISHYTKYMAHLPSLRYGRNCINRNNHVNHIPTFSAVMIKTRVLRELDYDCPVPAWLDFWMYRQILKDKCLYYTPEKLTYWRMHKASYNSDSNVEKYSEYNRLFLSASNSLIGPKVRIKDDVNAHIRTIARSSLFDGKYYVENCGEQIHGVTPAAHYSFKGWKKGKNPSVNFMTDAYIATYPDVEMSGLNPLVHYELIGKKEGRVFPTLAAMARDVVSEADIESLARIKRETKTILLINYDLSPVKVTRALLNLALKLKNEGLTPVMLSLQDGELRHEVEYHGIRLIIDPVFCFRITLNDDKLQRYLQLFDVVLFNTLTSNHLIVKFPLSDSIKISWLHDEDFGYQFFQKTTDVRNRFRLFDYVCASGNRSLSFVKKYTEAKRGSVHRLEDDGEIVGMTKNVIREDVRRILLDHCCKQRQVCKNIRDFRQFRRYTSKDYHYIKRYVIKGDVSFKVALKLITKICRKEKNTQSFRLLYKFLWYRFTRKLKNKNS